MKQFYLMIESFSFIAKTFPDWTLEIYGDGDEKNTLLELIKKLDLVNNVIIHPPTALVYEELYNSAFCALASDKESFGMVYIESFSMEKPVVSYDIDYGPKAFLRNEHNSLISPCFDKEHFARQMKRLIEDETLRNSLGRNARKTFIEKYEISKVMESLIKEINP
ncbi:MAG: glycosyltransferase [Enterobacterales bacterium endosymbiont of Blomia tropicalis]|uniref:glycosyltransferase n=1 Tax=Mixta mediterraneensis TaxID=2758443 RepID=UPI0025A71CA5|nr:glycosyltransferase [Mixta mediterraneensis]MDL4912839.1 glycosyltransferase [Mixta mediterraneensis]